MADIPFDKHYESTLAIARDPYRFISLRSKEVGSDVFTTRILLQKHICMIGRDAAELFYDETRFQRQGAAPSRIVKTLFGRGGVQTLDDEEHKQRKRLFTSLITPESVVPLGERLRLELRSAAMRWAEKPEVVLYQELQEVITRAVCSWAGVPLAESETKQRASELMALFDKAGSMGPPHWWARLARKRADRWIAGMIEQIRRRELQPPEGSAAHVMAFARDPKGAFLTPHVAAVELINVLRPTVAVSVFITFAALALHEHPEVRIKVAGGDPAYLEAFAQEVRRFYPFFPMTGALVRRDFQWKGLEFKKGMTALLDLYGTDHDPRLWDQPNLFRPERFLRAQPDLFSFIPQGGGDSHVTHRCPGEPISVELLKVSAEFLTREIKFAAPAQDLRIDMSRLPALPRSRFRMANLSVVHPAAVGS
ncbi:MAG: cytochrome P450 [Gemmataceae bacterium]|nr:cytochrome P450 [Gemmataceae bacterium]